MPSLSQENKVFGYMTVRMEHTVTVTLGWDGKTSPHSAPGAPPSFLTNQNPGSAHGCWHGEKETGGLTLTLFPVTTESRRSFNFEASHYFTFLTFCKMEWGFSTYLKSCFFSTNT